MKEARNLSDEELAMLSAPVDRPTAQWGTYQETGALRPVREETQRRRGGPFEALHAVGERLESEKVAWDQPWEADPWQIGSVSVPNLFATVWNLPGGALRGAGDVLSLMRPADFGAIGEHFAETGRLDARVGMTDAQRQLVDLTADVGTFAKGTFANPYDPANAALFDPSMTQERMPTLHAVGEMVESVLPATPWDPEYNPEWSENLSRLIQEESGEFALEIGLGAVLGGGGAVSGAVRRGTGAVRRGVRDVVSDVRMEGVFDLDDVDMLSGVDYGHRRQAATVELDIARREGFVGGGMGGVVSDPETGRTYISTAAHFVTGQRGEALDIPGIRARTGTGEIGTVQRVSAIDLERDIALLEVSGLSETLDIPDLPAPSAPHSLLGREGVRAEARVVGDSGAALETTTVVGVAGESGAPIISGGADIAGAYLGLLEQKGRVPRGMYADARAISELFGQIGDSGVRLGPELSRRAVQEGLHHRISRGDADVRIEGETPFVPRTPDIPAEVAAPAMLLPQFQLASESVELHSRDPNDTWRGILSDMIDEMDESRRADLESEVVFSTEKTPYDLKTNYTVKTLPTMFSRVGADPNLFFYVGERGADVSQLGVADRPQTRRFRKWLETRAPWDEFDFGEGSVLVPPSRMVSPSGQASQYSHILREGVVGFRDVTELGQHLKELGGAEDYSLQIARGRPASDVHSKFGFGGEASEFFLQPESLFEFDLPQIEDLRGIYGEILAEGGTVRQPGIDPATVVTAQLELGESGLWERQVVEKAPTERAPNEDYSDIQNMPEGDIHRWIAFGESTGGGKLGWVVKSKAELWRRRLSHPNPVVRREYQRWKRLDEATVAQRQSSSGLSFEHEAAEQAKDMHDSTKSYDPQEYKSEAWEPVTPTGEDDTGKYYAGWRDKQGDFIDDEELAEESLTRIDEYGEHYVEDDVAKGEEWLSKTELGENILSDPWIEERGVYDDLGQVHGDDATVDPSLPVEGKVSATEMSSAIKSGISRRSQEQIAEIFSGFIEKYERDEWIRENPGAFRSSVLKEIRQEGMGWHSTYRLAFERVQSLGDPDDFGGYYRSALSEQPEGWEQAANDLWNTGRFREFYEHLSPVYRSAMKQKYEALRRYGEYADEPEPKWIQARRENEERMLELEGITLGGRWLPQEERDLLRDYDRMARRQRRFTPESDAEIAERGSLEDRQRQAAALEVPAGNPLTRLTDFEAMSRHRIYREAAEADTLKRYGTDLFGNKISEQQVSAENPVYALRWHQRDALERELYDQSLGRTTRDPVEEIVGEAEVLRETRQTEIERRAAEASSAEFAYYEAIRKQQSGTGDAESVAMAKEAFDKATQRKGTWEVDTKLHSLPWEDVEPLDFTTPRAQRRGFSGIESERTYGLEIELITDLTRAEMEGELELQMAQGLALKYDLSLRTARSDVAVEHHPPTNLLGDRDVQRIEADDYSDMLRTPGVVPVPASAYRTRYAHELVFPVMEGESGIDLIDQTLRKLQTFETEMNTSMGMHIHVGAQDLTNYDLVGVWAGFVARENVIDLMHEPSRRAEGSSYAKSLLEEDSIAINQDFASSALYGEDSPFSKRSGQEIGRTLEFARKVSLLSDAPRHRFLDSVLYGSRYQKLNLRGFKHQTIEYRQPAPTLDIGEVEQHIGFITDFVDEFAGKPLEWVLNRDPRLQEPYAGLDLEFRDPDDIGQVLLKDPHEEKILRELRRDSVREEEGLSFDDEFADLTQSEYEALVRQEEELPERTLGELLREVMREDPSDAVSTELHSVDLTPSQREALEHTYGPGVVMAGPGSGKSRTLIERLRYLSDEGLATSDDVLTLVFGKKAQLDLTERAGELGGDWNIFTVDAFARSVVRENFGELGYTRAPDITESSFVSWLSKPGRLEEFGASHLSEDLATEWSGLYEKTRRGFTTGREDYSALSEPLQEAIRSYRLEKFEAGQMDFTDAISQAGYLLETNEAVRRRYQDTFKFLQVDEFQDVSPLQGRLIRNLSENPWVVGDLDQGIMSFRGGTGGVMREMIESGASVYNIEENFRSTPEIVGAAQGFIRSNLGRIDLSQQAVKPSGAPVEMIGVTSLTTEQQAIRRIAEQVREGEETAILTRTRRERNVIESELGVELRGQGWEESDIENLLTFETLHASKGREWQNVILPINLLESDFGNRQRLFTLPSPYAKSAVDFAEEERLFYVGMTRAQERLTIMGDPQHPYYSDVSRAISGVTEGGTPSYIGDISEPVGEVSQPRGGFFSSLIGRVGEALDRYVHGDSLKRAGRIEEQRTEVERRRQRTKTDLHSKDIDFDEINAMANEAAEAESAEYVPNVPGGVSRVKDLGNIELSSDPDSEWRGILSDMMEESGLGEQAESSIPDFLGEDVPVDVPEWGQQSGDLSGVGSDFLGPIRGRGLGLSDRFSRSLLETSSERSWGGASSVVKEMTQNAAVINVAASLAVEGVRTAVGHDLNVGSLVHASASSAIALGTTMLDARLGSRGVLPESRYNLGELAEAIEDVPAEAGTHLKRIFSDAGAGTARWGRGSLSHELSRYSMESLESMFGESGATYLLEAGYQSRRFGQRSYQTQRDWSETVLGIFSGDIPRVTRYAYDPESREVDVQTGRGWTLDRLIESGSERFAPLAAWQARREQLREDPSQDLLRHVFGPLQGEDVKPHVGYMMLPEARGIGRFFGRFHADPPEERQWIKNWGLEDIVRGAGATGWADRIAGRKEFRREHGSMLEDRRRSPELYQWQDPDHFFGEISGALGIHEPDFEGFGSERLGDPYSRFGRHFSRLPRGAKYPLIGSGAGIGGKFLYDIFFGDEEEQSEELMLSDPAGYSVSVRYPVLGAAQRTRPYRRLRARAENLLDEVYGEDAFHSEMMKSIVLGKKKNLPRDVKQAFVETGQIHALVQSGMHVSMFSNLLSRYPAIAAPAAVSVARDTLSPPDENVVEPSQSFWSKYTLSPDPWAPRWNPQLPSSGQIRMLKSQGLLSEDYELEIPEAPAWAWWDPVENYERDEARLAQKLATEGQVDLLRSQGLLPEDYNVSQHEQKEITLYQGEPGIQDVLPWTIYGMFGVIPETSYSYFNKAEVGKKRTRSGYNVGGFEFDVHKSPFPGFNPWLDPTPDGESWDFQQGLFGIGTNLFVGAIFGVGGDPDSASSENEKSSLLELYEKLGIDIEDGLSRDEASLLIEHQKLEREAQAGLATPKQIEALGKMYPEMNLEGLSSDLATQLFDAYEGYKESKPKKATEKQLTALERMYPDKDLTDLTREGASELFDAYVPPPKMATQAQLSALGRMYPERDLTGLTMAQASDLFDTYERPARSNEATGAQLDYLEQLRGGGFGDVVPIEQVDESDGLTRQEVSTLIDFEKAKQRSSQISREAAGPAMASQSQLQYLGQLNPERYGGLSGVTEGVMGIEEVTFDDGITAAEARTLFDFEDAQRKSRETAGPPMASSAQVSALERIFPEQFAQEPTSMEVEPANWLNVDIQDGITRQEAAHLFRSAEVGREIKGPPMASEAQVSALQRYFPKMFDGVEVEEEPLVPLEKIDFTDGVTREEAHEAFRHVTQIPPPMATPRQVARLEMEFPHAFTRLGQADQYLQSGESYGIVRSLEDIYDADTFTGMLFDAPSGQIFQQDTVRLGDFNAPEIKPDRMKPREYQEREAARAREARDVFRSMVERFNVGRDVEQQGYVVPIQFRQDPSMLGGLERGFYGRVLGDVNFEGVDYEQFMIQQQMGSVYGADVEWGAEDIDPLALWRKTPTYVDRVGKGAENLLWQIPETIVGGMLEGVSPGRAVTGTFEQVPGALKDLAVKGAKQTAIQATKDFFKESLTSESTPNLLSFTQRYIGDIGGIGKKAGSFLEGGLGAVLAPVSVAAGAALIGESSLDSGYAEVVPTAGDRKRSLEETFRVREEAEGRVGADGESAMRLIKQALREVLSEAGLGSLHDLSVNVSRKLRESDSRGITRGR